MRGSTVIIIISKELRCKEDLCGVGIVTAIFLRVN